MIDEKKIENAACVCGSHFIGDNEDAAAQYGFKKGVNWALQVFKKSLWHDRREKPTKSCDILFEYEKDKFYANYYSKDRIAWQDIRTIRWCYIDDLLPNKEDKK